nr:uncharacterized protein LOC127339307 [Lolium perenne]
MEPATSAVPPASSIDGPVASLADLAASLAAPPVARPSPPPVRSGAEVATVVPATHVGAKRRRAWAARRAAAARHRPGPARRPCPARRPAAHHQGPSEEGDADHRHKSAVSTPQVTPTVTLGATLAIGIARWRPKATVGTVAAVSTPTDRRAQPLGRHDAVQAMPTVAHAHGTNAAVGTTTDCWAPLLLCRRLPTT